MQQIASLGLLLTIFAGFGQVLCESGSTARNVIGDIREKFTTTGGTAVQGHLFRQCANEAAAVEGSLYSIDVTESKSFVRAVLKEDQDVAWTDTGLEADQGVVQCAIKALEVGAEMYKYDGLCWAHLQDESEDLLTTDCGTGDVVYVRKHNIFGGEKIPYGEYSGCFYSSPKGMTFGGKFDRLVEEHLPSEEVKCCPFLMSGICFYVDDIETQDINFCEAAARCEAFGLSILSIEVFQSSSAFSYFTSIYSSGEVPQTFPVNYIRDEQGVWKWMPSGTTESSLSFKPEPTVDQNCTIFGLGREYDEPANCEDAVGRNSVCFEIGTQLPQCA